MNESPEVKQLADDYEKALKVGQARITEAWRFLSPHTRAWLAKTGFYDQHGARTKDAGVADTDRVEDLEYALGVLLACAKAELPGRDAPKGSEIPRAACGEKIIGAMETVLYEPRARDPIFLRLALHALRQYEMGLLLMRLPTKPKASAGGLAKLLTMGLLAVVLMFLAPAILAFALVGVAQGDGVVAGIGFYVLAFFAWLVWLLRQKNPEVSADPDESAWTAWQRFGFTSIDGSWTACGVGAAELLRDLLRQGVKVRPLAFDLCAALTSAALGPYALTA